MCVTERKAQKLSSTIQDATLKNLSITSIQLEKPKPIKTDFDYKELVKLLPDYLNKHIPPLSPSEQKQVTTWMKQMTRHHNPLWDIMLNNYKNDYGALWAFIASPFSNKPTRIGKSILGIKLLFYAYMDWEIVKHFIIYLPSDFANIVETLAEHGVRIPLLLWDDAGAWLGRGRGKSRFISSVNEALETVHTSVTNLAFTATRLKQIAKSIHEKIPNIVTVTAKSLNHKGMKISLATLYDRVTDWALFSMHRSIPEPKVEWAFTVYIPDPIYYRYLALRNAYTVLSARKMKQELVADGLMLDEMETD